MGHGPRWLLKSYHLTLGRGQDGPVSASATTSLPLSVAAALPTVAVVAAAAALSAVVAPCAAVVAADIAAVVAAAAVVAGPAGTVTLVPGARSLHSASVPRRLTLYCKHRHSCGHFG